MELCKVRYDGYHHLVTPYKNTSSFNAETLLFFSKEDLGISENVEVKDFFVNEWALMNFPQNRGKREENEFGKILHDELKKLYAIIISNDIKITSEKLINDLYECITSEYEMIERYRLDIENENDWLRDYITKFVRREKENLKGRKGRFRRKALNNDWNYFVTFTYDDNKHDEVTFVKSLKKKLQNLHSRYNWLYMGCFERSKTERLHFHGLIYVPQGCMRGNIREEKYYDTNSHRQAISYINDDFEEKIGRNDFKPITKIDLTFTNALDYILKYIGKSDEKIIYSKGIKDDFLALVDFEENVICRVSENSPYYILGTNDIIEVDKNLNIKLNEV